MLAMPCASMVPISEAVSASEFDHLLASILKSLLLKLTHEKTVLSYDLY